MFASCDPDHEGRRAGAARVGENCAKAPTLLLSRGLEEVGDHPVDQVGSLRSKPPESRIRPMRPPALGGSGFQAL
jgi:hypothetical protein